MRVIPSIHICGYMLFEPKATTTSLVSWVYGGLGQLCVMREFAIFRVKFVVERFSILSVQKLYEMIFNFVIVKIADRVIKYFDEIMDVQSNCLLLVIFCFTQYTLFRLKIFQQLASEQMFLSREVGYHLICVFLLDGVLFSMKLDVPMGV